MRGHVLFGSSAPVIAQTCRQNHFRLYCCQVESTKCENQESSQCHKYSWGEDEQVHSIGELLYFWLELQVSRPHSLVCYKSTVHWQTALRTLENTKHHTVIQCLQWYIVGNFSIYHKNVNLGWWWCESFLMLKTGNILNIHMRILNIMLDNRGGVWIFESRLRTTALEWECSL